MQRQGVERSPDLLTLLHAGGLIIRSPRGIREGSGPFFFRDLLTAERTLARGALPLAVCRQVHGDPKEPRVKRRLPPKVSERLVRPNKDLLGEIQGLFLVLEQPDRESPDFLPVFLHELLEGVEIALPGSLDQLAVVV